MLTHTVHHTVNTLQAQDRGHIDAFQKPIKLIVHAFKAINVFHTILKITMSCGKDGKITSNPVTMF